MTSSFRPLGRPLGATLQVRRSRRCVLDIRGRHSHRFHAAGVGCGTEVRHAPEVHPECHESYYGAFLRDPDGNNVEAVCHTPA